MQKMTFEELEAYLGQKASMVVQFRTMQEEFAKLRGKKSEDGESDIRSTKCFWADLLCLPWRPPPLGTLDYDLG